MNENCDLHTNYAVQFTGPVDHKHIMKSLENIHVSFPVYILRRTKSSMIPLMSLAEIVSTPPPPIPHLPCQFDRWHMFGI